MPPPTAAPPAAAAGLEIKPQPSPAPAPAPVQLPPADAHGWRRLGTPRAELCLDFTLPTGQSFRWRRTAPREFTGVVGRRVVQLRQEDDDVAWRVVARGGGDADGGATAAPSKTGAAAAAAADSDAAAVAAQDAAALAAYLNLGVALAPLYEEWSSRDARFAAVAPRIPGARLLRQDPAECLFQFICSQNNHISRCVVQACVRMRRPLCRDAASLPTRFQPLSSLTDNIHPRDAKRRHIRSIQGMVERLCAAYGTPLLRVDGGGVKGEQGAAAAEGVKLPPLSVDPAAVAADEPPGTPTAGAAAPALGDSPPARRPRKRRASSGVSASDSDASGSGGGSPDAAAAVAAAASAAKAAPGPSDGHQHYYAFPTLEQLAAATEDELRALGFGYRARFIVAAAAELRARGGAEWLESLRALPAADAAAALEALPGVGPKVAACAALFSLDKHDAIPVDTHVWQLATKYYAPSLRGRALTKKLHPEVAAAFVERFGPRAGWAHAVLFISDLRQTAAVMAGGDGGDGGGGEDAL